MKMTDGERAALEEFNELRTTLMDTLHQFIPQPMGYDGMPDDWELNQACALVDNLVSAARRVWEARPDLM